jgi:hypothetical protein
MDSGFLRGNSRPCRRGGKGSSTGKSESSEIRIVRVDSGRQVAGSAAASLSSG